MFTAALYVTTKTLGSVQMSNSLIHKQNVISSYDGIPLRNTNECSIDILTHTKKVSKNVLSDIIYTRKNENCMKM